ncbi:MAG: small multi-drug export protein [bacterium]|nr:small multi-drug export protein [bacterium]
MAESLAMFFVNAFNGLSKEVIIFIISLMPILELRGGLIAASLLNVDLLQAFIICFVGNIFPVPFILLFIEKLFNWLKKFKKSKKVVEKLEKKTLAKRSQIDKYGYWGIFIFVAIPLPGTGAWTGALLAMLLGMEKKKSFLAITVGVMVAGIIMSIFSYGVLGNLIR